MGALGRLSSLMELSSLRLCLWQRQCNPLRYWQTQCNQATRQSECDSPLRGQSHSLCLLTFQHLLHIQNLVTPAIWYNIRRFRRLVSPLGASGSGFGIFQPPPVQNVEREKSASPFSRLSRQHAKTPNKQGLFAFRPRIKTSPEWDGVDGCVWYYIARRLDKAVIFGVERLPRIGV